MQKAVVIGVGPERGLGAQLCKRFAKEGLHVVAAARWSLVWVWCCSLWRSTSAI